MIETFKQKMKSSSWYKDLNKSPLTPPDWVFSVVWPVLYTLLGISFLVFNLYTKSRLAIYFGNFLFLSQLFFNLVWPIVFFKQHNIKNALSGLFLIVMLTSIFEILAFNYNRLVFYLMFPYFLWCFFALYLNAYIVRHN